MISIILIDEKFQIKKQQKFARIIYLSLYQNGSLQVKLTQRIQKIKFLYLQQMSRQANTKIKFRHKIKKKQIQSEYSGITKFVNSKILINIFNQFFKFNEFTFTQRHKQQNKQIDYSILDNGLFSQNASEQLRLLFSRILSACFLLNDFKSNLNHLLVQIQLPKIRYFQLGNSNIRLIKLYFILNKMIHQVLQNNFPQQIQVTKEFQEEGGLIPNENDDYMLIQKKFQFKLSDNNEILYAVDGRIIRIDSNGAQQIMTNLEQINHLHWNGKWDQNFKKIGNWTAQWKDDYEGVGGFYNENGNKQGIWKEMIINFWDQAKVYEIGEYVNGIRQGAWIYVFENKKDVKILFSFSGGGIYKENGLKNGRVVRTS
ncbi:unnamed protein product (macronuclear) [Paramecium tetraurelia]|uniref:Uncharacterized protein n=1 Tax=Paramecium tetraurelia TaxID=5888 RepID=A0CLQ6_PARTE|nr:uncharacterized protein GSPATT00038648001 [Paramecium tetraurelia]CAK71723.1 unnamed protein product [Paramecium tetraurelia]|eukprot:XP_001439120.1 hypothetical protein (macronuclear) [Paramecium tetraurelia strain d4-2]